MAKKLNEQVKDKVNKHPQRSRRRDTTKYISTGSTLLDLAISGTVTKEGGIPGGILCEIFGQSGSGKTVLLCEIAGAVQRQKGNIMFHDPEARLNKQFAKIFDLDSDNMSYSRPDRVPEVFSAVRKWEAPKTNGINGVFADSLAALSTNLEMDSDDGDKMGMRRAKEFSEELRKTCRILADKNFLLVCSNQVRQNADSVGHKWISPGGQAIAFYSSLRLRATKTDKITEVVRINGKETKRTIGVRTEFEVFKSSLDKPYRKAKITILFDYGIDDIRENLQFLKDYSNKNVYHVGDRELNKSMDKAIDIVESENLEADVKEKVIELWNTIESKFESNRKKKKR